ncbi:MAG: metal-dependent transcriptional regulator [Solobacterium sp.]|nr:metal-dependent transcriptional regulator [Solobacterium sp.]MBR2829951.1 metal-dependent transcriptional regulator [Solobacterium sp.]MBR3128494.1 metal-dependent transcriptional regulator [Solobacterium sp.]
MKIYQSAEDYLETILFLQEKNGYVRSVDIAQDRGLSKPSVSVAMKKLRENGYIQMDRDGSIKLLEPGYEIARRTAERHHLLTTLFIAIGVDPETAEDDACKIEHDLSSETFDRIKDYVSKAGIQTESSK